MLLLLNSKRGRHNGCGVTNTTHVSSSLVLNFGLTNINVNFANRL